MIARMSFIGARRGKTRDRGGFTLIELLVTMAVISVLISILLPVIGRARDQAKLALCKGRLRNVFLGVLMYANDNRSYPPFVEKLDNPHTRLILALGKRHYVDQPETFYCPSDTRPDLCFSPENLAAGNISYFYYSCEKATTNRCISTFLRWEVKWPRRLQIDMDPQTWVISDSWFSGEPTPHSFYKKGVNYVTLDGGVKMLYKSPRKQFR